jgi:AAA domain, putative AbiEii toxin, Type IV TA system/AAA domain
MIGDRMLLKCCNFENEGPMRIKKLRLKNGYKRFHDLTIDLGDTPARIVALVGPNGCGKSSVLDGLLYHHSQYGPFGDTAFRDIGYHSMNSEIPIKLEDVVIDFVDGDYKQVRTKRDGLNGNTLFSFRSPYRYNNQVKIDVIRATSAIINNSYGAKDASSLDSKMEENYRRLQSTVNNHMEKNDVKPSEARSKIIGELNASIKNCLDIEISSVGNVEAGKGTLYFTKAGQTTEFEFNVLSSGEKEVIDILLDLYLRKDVYNETVFLIDEPELHINTSIQRKLLIEIDKLVGERCQIWITTHSIGFLRAMQTLMKDSCQIIQFKSEYELASNPYILFPMKISASAWRELFAIALDDLANLVSPKTIIYCEGRAEPKGIGGERGMDAQALNAIFAETHPTSLFISSGGNTELDQRSAIAIAMLGKVLSELEVLIFKDRDIASGKIADENQRQNYLKTNPSNHRVMKRFELENYLYDKEVLKAYCSSNNLTFNETDYDAFVSDIVNQNLKDETGRIKNICGINTSVNSETFKVLLATYLSDHMAAYIELRDCIFNRA